MKSFEDLAYDDQVQRLEELAADVLTRYELADSRTQLLDGCNNNVVLRIDAVVNGSPGRFAFRIPRRSHRTASSVQSEIRWLDALSRDTDLVVPKPVPARDGSIIQAVKIPGFPELRHATLFCWVYGEFFYTDLTVDHLRQIGVFTACLHEHAKGFAKLKKLDSQRCDLSWLPTSLMSQLNDTPATLKESDRMAIVRATQQVLATFDEIETTAAEILFIHGDLHQMNLLFHENQVRAIDFEWCGFSHPMFDLGSMLRQSIGERTCLSCVIRSLKATRECARSQMIMRNTSICWNLFAPDFEQNRWRQMRVTETVELCKLYLDSEALYTPRL